MDIEDAVTAGVCSEPTAMEGLALLLLLATVVLSVPAFSPPL